MMMSFGWISLARRVLGLIFMDVLMTGTTVAVPYKVNIHDVL